jgi:hypothetical protein
MTILLQAGAFLFIAVSFIFCCGLAMIEQWTAKAFRKPIQRREAVIIPFPDRSSTRRGKHV